MNLDDALAKLQPHAGDLHALGVSHLYLFGSTVHNKATADSDVDLFLDVSRNSFSLIDLLRTQEKLAAILGRPADVMTRESLHPRLRGEIERDAVQVF